MLVNFIISTAFTPMLHSAHWRDEGLPHASQATTDARRCLRRCAYNATCLRRACGAPIGPYLLAAIPGKRSVSPLPPFLFPRPAIALHYHGKFARPSVHALLAVWGEHQRTDRCQAAPWEGRNLCPAKVTVKGTRTCTGCSRVSSPLTHLVHPKEHRKPCLGSVGCEA